MKLTNRPALSRFGFYRNSRRILFVCVRSILVSSMIVLLAWQVTRAANGTWLNTGAADGNWTTTSNWVGGTVPGSTVTITGTNNNGDTATFNTAVGTFGTSGNPIVIDSTSENIKSITFDTASVGSYFIGATNLNSLFVTSGGAISLTATAVTATETINAPIVIEGASGTYSFTNNSTSTGLLNFGGQISGGNASAQTLNINGNNTGNNTISGNIVNGTATSLAVTKSGNGQWVLAGSGNSYTGTTTVSAGTLTLTGSLTGSGSNILVTGGTFSETSTGVIATGAGTFTQTGGTATLQGANTYAGTTTIGTAGSIASGGTLTVSGASGTISNSSGISIIGSGSILKLDNATTNNNDRIGNTVTLSYGGELNLVGNGATASTTENISTLGISSGTSIVTINGTGAGQLVTLAAANFSRSNFGTALIRGTSLGSAASNAGSVTVGSGLTLIGTNTSSAGDQSGTTKNLVIVPYFTGDTSATGAGAVATSGLVTYDTTSGLRVLGANEYDVATTVATDTNVNVATSAAGVVTGSKTYNALMLQGNNVAANLTGDNTGNLTVSSGVIYHGGIGGSAIATVSGFGKITLGNGTFNEGILTNWNNTNALTINSTVDVTGSGGLTKGGTGTVILGASNLYSGVTTVNAGTLQIGTGTAGDLGRNTANIVLNGGNLSFGRTNSGLTLSNIISGVGSVIQNGAGGTTVLSGNNTYTGATTVSAGTLNVTGAINGGNVTNGQILVADGTSNASLVVNGGTINAKSSTNPALAIGGSGASATGAAVLVINSGTVTSGNEVWVGTNSAATGFGALLMNGGTLTTQSYLALGRGQTNNTSIATRGELVMTNGTININTNNLEIGSFQLAASTVNVMSMSGGKVNLAAGAGAVVVGQGETGILDMSGGTITANATGGNGLRFNNSNNGQTSIVNLRGGTITVGRVTTGGSTSIFNFNGGTLQALAGTTNGGTFMTGLTNAYVYGGGGTIDNNGQNITIGQALLTPTTGSGVTLGTVAVSGSGFVAPPIVTITGGGGTGATAAATIDANGNITGVTITNAGVGYTSAPTLNFFGGGSTVTLTGSLSTAANTSGGMAFLGKGITTLSGSSTYTGNTAVAMGNTTGLNSAATLNLSFATNQINIVNNTSNSSALILGGSLTSNATTVLGGGQLTLTGVATSTNTQRFNGLTVGTGGNNIVFANNATANTIALNVGAITRAVGGTLHITQPTGTVSSTNGVQTSTGAASTILTDANGTAFATVGTSTPTTAQAGDWAAKDATNAFIVGGSTISGFYTTANSAATFTSVGATGNADITGSFTATAGTNVGSIRMNGATVNLNLNASTTTIGTGGVLFGSSTNQTISNGTIRAGAGKELVFINTHTGTPQINAVITDSASGASSVTYRALELASGQGGFQIGSAGNTYTGNTYIEGGRVSTGVSTAFGTGTGTGGNVYIDGNTNGQAYLTGGTFANHFYLIGNGWNEGSGPFGVLRLQNATVSGQVTLLGNATISDQGGTGTINGVIDDGGSAYALTVNGSGTLILANANTYTGTTTISAGTLQLGNSGTTGSLSTSSAIINNATLSVKRSDSVAQGTDFSGSAITGSGAFIQAGGGTTTLNAANSYTGVTSIQNGVLSINSIANVGGGASAIGAPTTTASGTIAIGSGGATGQLTYTGSATTTNRVINLAGTTGGATIDQSGTGLLKFTSALTATGAGGKTLTLQGSTAGTGELAGAIVDNSGTNTTSVIKTGSGKWTLSGTNTYTGPTTVSGGNLVVSGSLNGTLLVNVFSGGTLASGATGSIATATGGDISIGGTLAPGDLGAVGTLTLAPGTGGTLSFLSDSTINFTISGATSDLVSFSTTGDWLNGSDNVTLSLTGITASDYGNTYTVFHNVSTAGFAVAGITGYDSANYIAAFTQVGSDYQLSFTAVPEPSMSMSLLGGMGVLCLLRHRRRKSQA